MLHLFKARLAHGYQAIPNPLTTSINPSFPGLPILQTNADMKALQDICPAKAFSAAGIDLGKCIFCGKCQRKYPQYISFQPNFQMASNTREGLIVAPGQTEYHGLPKSQKTKGRFKVSFAMRNVSAAGCNACELELGASSNVNFDIGRYGIEVVASPRHADALIITGPISQNMAFALNATWEAIPTPKYIILCGACAISGGIFATSEKLDRSFLADKPISLYIPGCPAHPLSIVHGIYHLMRLL